MSWEKWDAEHRSAGVRETKMSEGSTKVTSGGKHLGNINHQGGKHLAVTKVNGSLQAHEFTTHQGALNHIRKTHGLPTISTKKTASAPTAVKKTAAPPQSAAAARDAMHAAPPTKKTAAPFHAWNAEHGSGGGGVSSADKIAASIRGALGPGKMDAPKVESKTGKSGSTISRAAESRSTASHVLKKDMKRPAPVKGEKDAADAFRTKIRMAAYNNKKKAAVAADPVNQHTSHVEEKINPHTGKTAAPAPGSSAAKIAAAIKGAHAEQHDKDTNSDSAKLTAAADKASEKANALHTVPALVEQKHAEGSAEDLANKADAATHLANASPSYVNHQKAYEAHGKVLASLPSYGAITNTPQFKAREYHVMMQGYHRFAADNPSKVIPASVKEEHVDKTADRLPQPEAHQRHAAFTDTASRRHSQQTYEAIPKASASNLTAAHKESIRAYTGSGYTTINAYHRHVLNGSGSMSTYDTDMAKKHTANLDAAFAKQPALQHDLVTYRGVSHSNKMFGKVGEKVGGEFVDHGYTSTTSHAGVGAGFGGGAAGATAESNTLVRVLHPAGSKVLKPSEVGGFGDSEREILTPRGTRYHIAADRVVTLQNGRTQRQVDLVRK